MDFEVFFILLHMSCLNFTSFDPNSPYQTYYFNISLEITIFWISEVPSPIVQSLESR